MVVVDVEVEADTAHTHSPTNKLKKGPMIPVTDALKLPTHQTSVGRKITLVSTVTCTDMSHQLAKIPQKIHKLQVDQLLQLLATLEAS